MGRLRDRLDALQPREAARGGRGRALREREDPAERLERPDELQEQLVEEEELAVGERAADHLAAAEVDDRADRERRQEEQAGQERRLDARLPQHAVAHGLGLVGEARLHVVLAAERLHHLDPDDRLVCSLGDVRLQLLHLARDRHHLAGEREREQERRRHRDQRDRRELHVDEEEDDRDPDDHHHRLDALRHAPADEVTDGIEVVRRARDDLPGRVPVVERARVAQVRLVEQLAHARLDADAGARGRVAADEVDEEADDRQHDHDREVRPERGAMAVRRRDRVVDRVPDDDRDREREARVDERAYEPEDDEPSLLAPQLGEPLRRRPEAEIRRIDGERAPAHLVKLH